MKSFVKKMLLLLLAILMPIMAPVVAFATTLTPEQLLDFSQNNILYYDPSVCNEDDYSGGLTGTGDYAKILTAKNADKSFFNGSGDVPSAWWSDTDTGSMRTLLETYGDLAYQLGEAVGAPWIAILVQMRYEDSDSVCGRNNFWGNGCDSSHAYTGGATKQGKNLGEGFMQYAETLTNGYYDRAMGIADPKEYLMALGPIWVQGDINGAGYSDIEGMKRSVDALTAYVESAEGQEIVKTFGNYHGTGGRNRCRCGEKADIKGDWKDGWLVDDSITGMKREDVNGKTDLNESPNKMYGYTTNNGRPNKILLHNTEGTLNGYAAYPAGNKYPAHFTIDPKKKEGYQHFSIYQPALAIRDYDSAGPIQIEIVGVSAANSNYSLSGFTDEDWDYLADVLLSIAEEAGIPLTSTVDWAKGAPRLSGDEFSNYEGVLGHMHAPANDHDDPGDIWQYIDAAIQRKGGYDSGCFTSGNGDINATAIKLAWPLSEYGQHHWSQPNPEYAKALAQVGMTTYGDSCVEAGGSCDAFVATVMRYSGADPDFYCCGVSVGYMLNYLVTSGKFAEVQNGLGNLRPGDIRIGEHHIELYVEVDGEPRIASASYCDRNGDIGYYYDNNYRVFRLK